MTIAAINLLMKLRKAAEMSRQAKGTVLDGAFAGERRVDSKWGLLRFILANQCEKPLSARGPCYQLEEDVGRRFEKCTKSHGCTMQELQEVGD